MGEYAPDDQRNVHKSDGGSWQQQQEQQQNQSQGGQPGDQQQAAKADTGSPRPEYDQYEVNQPGNLNKQSEAQSGYGNARNEDGQMEQDIATSRHGDQPLAQGESINSNAQPGEISDRPDERAAADANRPLGGS
jgi:hypothetical protein